MEDCLFCKIKNDEIPSTKVYEDDDFFIIKDINPKAKIHLLAIPNVHYATLDLQSNEGAKTFGMIVHKISLLASTLGLENGYRLQINQGKDGGQEIGHVHIHILGGEKLD